MESESGRRGEVPVFGGALLAPAAAAGMGAAAEDVAVGLEAVAVPELPACCLFLRREKRPLRPFFTCATASGATMLVSA